MLHSILIYEVCFCRYLLDVNLDMRALCAINRKVPSVSVAAHNVSQGANMTFSILTFADRAARQSSPSFLESRSIYANLHGYSLRMFFHKLDASREFVWSKLPGVHEVLFGRGSSTWVWVVDLDTLIFNFGVKLESFVQAAEADAKRRSSSVDLIIAQDHNGVNAGSFLIKKSEWTRNLLQRWWSRNESSVPRIDKLFEQAALEDLIRSDPEVSSHVHILPIRAMNAYGYPASSIYLFREGDFLVHCPGPKLKKWLNSYVREWDRMMDTCNLQQHWMDGGLRVF